MFDYDLREPAGRDIIESLKKNYDVEVFDDFPKPFFRIRQDRKFLLTGAVGLDSIRVTYREECPVVEKESLEQVMTPYLKEEL